MSIEQGGVRYLTATEAIQESGYSRQIFYQSIKPLLSPHTLPGYKSPFYRAEDVASLSRMKAQESLPLIVQGISKNFEQGLREQGYTVTVETLGVPSVIPMNEQLAAIFKEEVGSPVVQRRRRQKVNGIPYRCVANYYPVSLVGSETLAAMQQDHEADVLDLIKQEHHIIITHTHEQIQGRLPTQEERRLLGIRSSVPVLEIQRTNYAGTQNLVVMYNELILVTSYFLLEYDYAVDHWHTKR